ncbi:MAG: hypothetical protein B7O98_06610 [Zestosphaera tikiterensis]|uniref:PaREP6 n=1 Tax=Zestosphaera tikiterensis TaxID=1973259 RepID=A0A2R7Y4Z0_9CREN|nr:MAG: hypothetical protein B7O98_06610 [Zestosphaera tikiterensis]
MSEVLTRRKKWEEEDREAREIRRKYADWSFIESQPEPIKSALKCFIELGDLYVASRIANMSVDEFNELRKKARIPVVV